MPVGCKYKVTEDASDYFASYEITDAVSVVQQKQNNDQENQSLSTGKETVDKDKDAVVTFTNTEKESETPEIETTRIHVKKFGTIITQIQDLIILPYISCRMRM